MKTMTAADAAKQIAAILAQCSATADLETIAVKGAEMAEAGRETKRMARMFPRYNAEERSEGRPELTWRAFLIQAKADGEYGGPIPAVE